MVLRLATYANDSSIQQLVLSHRQHCLPLLQPSLSLYLLMVLSTRKFHLLICDASDGSVSVLRQGSGSNDVVWEGTTFTDGDTFFDIADVSAVEI